MKLTPELKAWLVKHAGVEKDAEDSEFIKAASEALVSGNLSADDYAKLTSPPKEEESNEFSKQLADVNDGISTLVKLLTPKPEDKKEEKAEEKKEEKKEEKDEEPAPKKKAPLTGIKKILIASDSGDNDGKEYDVRVKEAAEMYDDTKAALTYPSHTKSGRPHPYAGCAVKLYEAGRILNEGSELDRAVKGAFAKLLVSTAQKRSKTLGFQSLPPHDKELVCYALEKMKWNGSSDGGDYADIRERYLTPSEQKALIDDATSGGLEAAPIVFDDDVIQAPLLHGELFPLVNTVPLDRGRRVEGVSTGTVTGAWGGVDDTAITLFTTTSYVSAFDTTIYRWEGAIRVGLDFLSDSPVDFGAHISAQYGERLLEDLDDVIAAGNGTTQPEGVINKSGTTTVAWGGATSIGNYESLRFAVAKAEHRGPVASSAVFCGTETSYQRARALAVGASDARRLFGMNYDSYSIMERPYKINETLANTQIWYAILARYRMYVRRGLTMRTSTEGDTLIRNNEMLMVAMARYGGQLERGAAGAITTTAPA